MTKQSSFSRDLCAVIIARDESRVIERCIQSLVNVVDRVVVYDTGSIDDTIQLARNCGAEVFEGEWKDDFSIARNTALALADANWNLIIDADEWFQSGADCLSLPNECPLFLGVVSIQSEYAQNGDSEYSAIVNSWITRLIPRGVLYEGRVHEQPDSNLPRVRLPIVIGHDGYKETQLEKKIGRNRKLLELELLQNPEDAYLLYQIGKDCEVCESFSEAALHYQQSLLKIPANATYKHDLTVRLIHCLSKTGMFEEGIQLANDSMVDLSDSPDFFFVYGNLLLDCAVANPDEAFDTLLPLAELAWLRCLEIGEQPDLDGSVVGRGSYLAAHNLAVIYEGMGDSEKADLYRKLTLQKI